MYVFVTGASGFIGEATVKELVAAGHSVRGLARSEDAAAKVTAAGGEAVRGELTDLDVLRDAAVAADGVIHLGFIHDFSRWDHALQVDREAIAAMLEALGTGGKPFVGTTGTLGLETSGDTATEDDKAPHSPRQAAETLVRAAKGVRGAVVRLSPTVHGKGDGGFTPTLIGLARRNGAAVYAGDGSNAWQSVYREDAAKLYRLVLEKGEADRAYHGVTEQAVTMRALSEYIAQGLGVQAQSVSQDEAGRKLGMLARFAAMGIPVSSERTQRELRWQPTGPTLFDDMREHYFTAEHTTKYS